MNTKMLENGLQFSNGSLVGPEIQPETLIRWKCHLDFLAKISKTEVAMLTKAVQKEFEVLLTNSAGAIEFQPGQKIPFLNKNYSVNGLGRSSSVLTRNSLWVERWPQDNLVKNGWKFYAGIRINNSDGSVFGTLCVMSHQDPRVSQEVQETLYHFREVIENDLAVNRSKKVREFTGENQRKFFENLSDRMRNPLGAIIGFIEILKNMQHGSDEMMEFISIIDRNSKDLYRIANEVFELSKIDSDPTEFEKIEFSLRDLLMDFYSSMEFRAREKGLDLRLQIATQVPERIIENPMLIRQILNNTVGNAIKFTKHGHVLLGVQFESGLLEFRIIDTGQGISLEEQKKLFSPSIQVIAPESNHIGLGLMHTKKLAEMRQGTFWLHRSVLGFGSEFRVQLKVEVARKFCVPLPQEVQQIENPRSLEFGNLRGMKVLLVEDSLDNQYLIKRMLTNHRIDVEVASNGKEGFDRALSEDFDLVLMDVQMPIMDGHEATRQLRACSYTKPIVALTAHAMLDEKEKTLASGFTDFLSKPVDRKLLLETIQRYDHRYQTAELA
jgi:signal transduction histidine kinase/CheY-like chemotaxis protein